MTQNKGLTPARWTIDIGGGRVLAREITAVGDLMGNSTSCTVVLSTGASVYGTRRSADVIADWHEWLRAMDAYDNQSFAERYRSLSDEIAKAARETSADILDELNKRD